MTKRHHAAILIGCIVLAGCAPPLPDYDNANDGAITWLDQQWSEAERAWFHHISQGTATFPVPYEWFLALEEPKLSFFGDPARLSDPRLLSRMGFVKSPKSDANPDGLPVGFTRDQYPDPVTGKPIYVNPKTGKPMSVIGLTCAACHTGQLNYKGTAIGIDGGPAATDLDALSQYLGLALFYAKYIPGRSDRLADKVIGKDRTAEQEAAFEAQLDGILGFLKKLKGLSDKHKKQNVTEGFTRLDALNRIGNQVFSVAIGNDDNFAATNAPVNYPHIWDASWFLWVQYDASIMQPMVRNAGEALGVAARVNLVNSGKTLFRSGVRVKNLFAIEELLAGLGAGKEPPTVAKAFAGLAAPQWPEEILGKIDWELALGDGRRLYKEHCQGCHLPPVRERSGAGKPAQWNPAFFELRYWIPAGQQGRSYLRLHEIPLSELDTDPSQAEVMVWREVQSPGFLKLGTNSFAGALGAVVEKVTDYWYANQSPPITGVKKEEMNGFRENELRALFVYKARPLDGIWATPPYLHNGSVPNIFALLSPTDERPAKFYLGSREYDPEHLGYVHKRLHGGTEIDTSIKGNWNTGHLFDGKGTRADQIGPHLEPDQRMALIEYLKTL